MSERYLRSIPSEKPSCVLGAPVNEFGRTGVNGRGKEFKTLADVYLSCSIPARYSNIVLLLVGFP